TGLGGTWQLDVRTAGARGEVPFGTAALGDFHELLGTWSSASSMVTPRLNQTATLLGNGKVLVAGDTGSKVDLARAELYDPASNTWSPAPSMAARRDGLTVTR